MMIWIAGLVHPLLRETVFTFSSQSWLVLPDPIGCELFTSVPPTEATQGESCTGVSSSIPESSNVACGYESQPGCL